MIPPRNTNEVVIESITQAMASMIIERPFEEISITELVRRAGVSRNSFYRNFRDKDDVLRRYIEGETEEWMTANGWVHTVDPMRRELRLEKLLTHMYGYRTFIAALIRDRKMHILEAEFDRVLEIGIGQYYDPWRLAFLIGGIYNLYVHWVETDYALPPQEVPLKRNTPERAAVMLKASLCLPITGRSKTSASATLPS